MPTIPDYEPETIIKGDTVKWERSFSDYRADDGWQLSYTMGGAASISLSFGTEISASNDGFVVNIPAATTGGFTVGNYWFRAAVSKDGEVYTVDEGTLRVVETSNTWSEMLHVKTTLDAISAVIENRATKDQESYSVAGRTLSRTPISELLVLRSKYRSEYMRLQDTEKLARGQSTHKRIQVRF